MMIDEQSFLTLVNAYSAATGKSDTAVSSKVFSDGKRVGAIRDGATITVRRLNNALRWFSAHWPANTEWPENIVRPEAGKTEATQ